ncbi:MAG: DUF58 domain-containing protein [Cyclobacteriaceae bacterium]|nr:DUF58 domain-containing protein [Cyclobacteriaceae bacterium]
MHPGIKDLLKPELLNTVNGLELVARILVEGFISGSNRSQMIGLGQEFSQYRSYEPGDDLRLLDWKMYARSERYFTKLADIETNITVKLVMDVSHSMAYEEQGVSKLHYTRMLIAALTYLARKQGDAFGLYCINDTHIDVVHPRIEQQQFIRVLTTLIHSKAEGKWNRGENLESILQHHGKELFIFISDLYDEQGDILNFISLLKTKRNEVLVLHLLGKQERELEFEGSFTFEDLESGARIKADTATQQTMYRKQVTDWIGGLRNQLLERQIGYEVIAMEEPVENVLRNFLNNRKKLL